MTDVERIKYICRKTVEAGDNCDNCIFSKRTICIFDPKPCMWKIDDVEIRMHRTRAKQMHRTRAKQMQRIIGECRKHHCNRCKLWNGYECAFLNAPLFWDTEFINDKVRMKYDE